MNTTMNIKLEKFDANKFCLEKTCYQFSETTYNVGEGNQTHDLVDERCGQSFLANFKADEFNKEFNRIFHLYLNEPIHQHLHIQLANLNKNPRWRRNKFNLHLIIELAQKLLLHGELTLVYTNIKTAEDIKAAIIRVANELI